MLGHQRTIWPWPRPSVAYAPLASRITETWLSGPGYYHKNATMWGQLCDPVPRSPVGTFLGLPEGRIPMAPEFMAMFILSQT